MYLILDFGLLDWFQLSLKLGFVVMYGTRAVVFNP